MAQELPNIVKVEGNIYRINTITDDANYCGCSCCIICKDIAYGVTATECPFTTLCMAHKNPWGVSIYLTKNVE